MSYISCGSLLIKIFSSISEVLFEKAYCEYRLNRVESALKTIEGAPEQTDKLKELYGQVVRLCDLSVTMLIDTANEDHCIKTEWMKEDNVPGHCSVDFTHNSIKVVYKKLLLITDV